MKNTFLYRRRKEISVLIFLLSIIIVPLYLHQADKELFEKSGGYNRVVVGVITKNCYYHRNRYDNKHEFTFQDKVYEGFGSFKYESECKKYQKGDSVLIEFSNKYPDKFNSLIGKIPQ